MPATALRHDCLFSWLSTNLLSGVVIFDCCHATTAAETAHGMLGLSELLSAVQCHPASNKRLSILGTRMHSVLPSSGRVFYQWCRVPGSLGQFGNMKWASLRVFGSFGHLCIAGIASHREFNDGKSSQYAMIGSKLDLVVLTKWLCLKYAYLRRVRP